MEKWGRSQMSLVRRYIHIQCKGQHLSCTNVHTVHKTILCRKELVQHPMPSAWPLQSNHAAMPLSAFFNSNKPFCRDYVIMKHAGGKREMPFCAWKDTAIEIKLAACKKIAQGHELHERSWILSNLWLIEWEQHCDDYWGWLDTNIRTLEHDNLEEIHIKKDHSVNK